MVVCRRCWLTQTEGDFAAEEFFSPDYAYFSSFSSAWLKHAERYSAEMITRFGLDKESKVVEVASNDGYLLQNFKAAGIPCLGVEPTASTAKAAIAPKRRSATKAEAINTPSPKQCTLSPVNTAQVPATGPWLCRAG